MRSRRPDTAQRDSGAVMLLAIGFVLLVSAIAAALAALIISSTATGNTLQQVRNRQYAADAAIQSAITKVRSQNRATAPVCGDVSTLNGIAVRVDCAYAVTVVGNVENQVLSQRNVIFLACTDTGSACDKDVTIIRAQVNFEQKYSGEVTKTYFQSWSVNR
ncbi:MAG: hypothetical protein WCH93_11840 [Actinomycetota bacterium]